MIKYVTIIVLMLFTFSGIAQGQEKEKQKILAEAMLLYRSERASWIGTDIFMEKYPEKKSRIGGYLSYSDEKGNTCIFYDNGNEPTVLATIVFDNTFVLANVKRDTTARGLTANENELYTIRQKASELAQNDTLFKHYKNMSLNIIPIITKNSKRVYMLTGPAESGVVVIGNDYLVEFDGKNNIKSKKALHNNIIPIKYSNNPDEESTFHNHNEATGDLITATDICTLMLYSQYTPWQQHYVVSKKYISIWDCNKESLFIMTTKAWERIYEDQKKSHP